jgi:hypothetical protein
VTDPLQPNPTLTLAPARCDRPPAPLSPSPSPPPSPTATDPLRLTPPSPSPAATDPHAALALALAYTVTDPNAAPSSAGGVADEKAARAASRAAQCPPVHLMVNVLSPPTLCQPAREVSQVCCPVWRRCPAARELCTHLVAAQRWLRHPRTSQTRMCRLQEHAEKCRLSLEGKCISRSLIGSSHYVFRHMYTLYSMHSIFLIIFG